MRLRRQLYAGYHGCILESAGSRLVCAHPVCHFVALRGAGTRGRTAGARSLANRRARGRMDTGFLPGRSRYAAVETDEKKPAAKGHRTAGDSQPHMARPYRADPVGCAGAKSGAYFMPERDRGAGRYPAAGTRVLQHGGRKPLCI